MHVFLVIWASPDTTFTGNGCIGLAVACFSVLIHKQSTQTHDPSKMGRCPKIAHIILIVEYVDCLELNAFSACVVLGRCFVQGTCNSSFRKQPAVLPVQAQSQE